MECTEDEISPYNGNKAASFRCEKTLLSRTKTFKVVASSAKLMVTV
jgi:hypothetical protein